ncbi:hypothetical protein [Nocardioides bruguierae]|uniref:hypothetical protein n=1 Tax=Nocardioides bruguierae TaxID=2945102 RepID=UPI002022690A|nr:hypothetical protein [Nocardioides bruguierae]MCL8026809.1 hypothetical protein [Nocardioides bruguierae]
MSTETDLERLLEAELGGVAEQVGEPRVDTLGIVRQARQDASSRRGRYVLGAAAAVVAAVVAVAALVALPDRDGSVPPAAGPTASEGATDADSATDDADHSDVVPYVWQGRLYVGGQELRLYDPYLGLTWARSTVVLHGGNADVVPVWTRDGSEPQPLPVATDDAGSPLYVSGVEVSPDGGTVAWIEQLAFDDTTAGEDVTVQVARMDLDTGEVQRTAVLDYPGEGISGGRVQAAWDDGTVVITGTPLRVWRPGGRLQEVTSGGDPVTGRSGVSLGEPLVEIETDGAAALASLRPNGTVGGSMVLPQTSLPWGALSPGGGWYARVWSNDDEGLLVSDLRTGEDAAPTLPEARGDWVPVAWASESELLVLDVKDWWREETRIFSEQRCDVSTGVCEEVEEDFPRATVQLPD